MYQSPGDPHVPSLGWPLAILGCRETCFETICLGRGRGGPGTGCSEPSVWEAWWLASPRHRENSRARGRAAGFLSDGKGLRAAALGELAAAQSPSKRAPAHLLQSRPVCWEKHQ